MFIQSCVRFFLARIKFDGLKINTPHAFMRIIEEDSVKKKTWIDELQWPILMQRHSRNGSYSPDGRPNCSGYRASAGYEINYALNYWFRDFDIVSHSKLLKRLTPSDVLVNRVSCTQCLVPFQFANVLTRFGYLHKLIDIICLWKERELFVWSQKWINNYFESQSESIKISL